MSLKLYHIGLVPEETARIARAAYPRGCAGYLAYLFLKEPLISDEWHGSENERQDLQAVETGEFVREVAIF